MKINDRLLDVSARAGFTMSDMAIWCEYDKGAMRMWMRHGVKPHPLKQRHLNERLDMLEKVISAAMPKGFSLPIPPEVRQFERKNYVAQVRVHALGKFSQRSASKRRV